MRAALTFLLLAVAAGLPVAVTGGWSGTEGRRVQIAAEMLVNADYLVPTLAGEVTLAKPPGYYWVLAAMRSWFGAGHLAMRLPSLLSIAVAAWLAWRTLTRSHGRPAGWIAGLAIVSSPVVLHHAAFAEIDPMFAAATAVSILWLGSALAYGGRALLLAAGLAGGVALMLKGPPYFLFLAGPLLVWARHRRLRGAGWFALGLLAPPAVYYAVLIGTRGLDELLAVAAEESVGRAVLFELEHVLDTPVHFVRAAAITLPFGAWTFAEFRGRHEARVDGPDLLLRSCAAAMVGGVLLLACFPGRSVRYLLPGALLFCCAVAPAVATWVAFPHPLRSGQVAIVRALGGVGALALPVLPWLRWPLPGYSTILAAGLATAPLWVRTRSRLVAAAIALPLLAAVTAFLDHARRDLHGPASAEDVAAVLRGELRERAIAQLDTFGHVTNAYLFGSGVAVRGDEFARRAPSSRWLLLEEHDSAEEPHAVPDHYVERVRLRAHRRTVVLYERDGP